MKSLKTIQTLSKIGRVLSKIAFILSFIGFGGCAVGLLSLGFGSENVFKIGGVTLHGLIDNAWGYDLRSLAAALFGWMIVCAGEAVVAKFAEIYFRNEGKAGTPFTLAGANELLRLGILTLAISTGCAVVGSAVEEIFAGFMNVETIGATDLYFNNGGNIGLGIMFLVISLLCRYGAELIQNDRP